MSKPAAPGRVLDGRYRLDSLIARGGMASVWAAEDSLLARRVAVKTLHPELAVDETLRIRFRNEAVAVASLTHPDIVATYDTGDDDGLAYLVMELVDGPNLRALLDQRGRLSVEETLRVARGVTAALDHAHHRGIVHRDIKPANVLVPDRGPVKVTDFGIAKAAGGGDLTRTGTVVGTAKYLAPEQVKADPVDARSDLYAVGLLLFEMLAGRAAFTGATEMETALARLTTTPPPLRTLRSDVSPGLEAITIRCLALDPDDRYPDAAALLAALGQVAGDSTSDQVTPGRGGAPAGRAPTGPAPSAPPPAPPAGPVRRRRRSPLPWVILGMLLLAAGTAGGYYAVKAVRDDSNGQGASATGVVPQVVGASDFDPEGDDTEHPDAVAAAIDGNDATSWTSESYGGADFGGLKSGVGLRLDLASPSDVAAVGLDTAEGGWNAEVYVADGAPDSLAAWGPPRAKVDDAGTSALLDLGPAPPVGSSVLVWFTRLPRSGRVTVNEVRVA